MIDMVLQWNNAEYLTERIQHGAIDQRTVKQQQLDKEQQWDKQVLDFLQQSFTLSHGSHGNGKNRQTTVKHNLFSWVSFHGHAKLPQGIGVRVKAGCGTVTNHWRCKGEASHPSPTSGSEYADSNSC